MWHGQAGCLLNRCVEEPGASVVTGCPVALDLGRYLNQVHTCGCAGQGVVSSSTTPVDLTVCEVEHRQWQPICVTWLHRWNGLRYSARYSVILAVIRWYCACLARF